MTVPITTNAVGDIIALVQLGLGAVQRLNNARGAKAEYREIQSRLTGLQSLLEQCTASVNSLSDPGRKGTVMAHIDRARAQLTTALQLLPGYERLAAGTLASPVSTLRSIRSCVRAASKSIRWELRQSANAGACLAKLSESIQTIHLAITAASSADTNMQFRSLSSIITNATAATIAMQTNLSVTRSLIERDSEIQATRHQIVVDEVAEVREDLSSHTRLSADLQRTVEAPKLALELVVSLRGLSLSATTLIQISQAVVPSNELVSGGCIGSFLVFAVSAPRMTDQAAYLFCACLLFIATRMHRIYQSPVVIHIVVIVDLFGDRIQLPLHEARSAEEVHAVLQRQFQPGRIGCIITHNRLYDLAILDDEDALGNLLPRSWANLLQPGQTLAMTARVQDTNSDTNSTCPSCRTPFPQPEELTIRDRWMRCSRCPARFNRETIDDLQEPHTASHITIEQELVRCKRIRVLDLNPTSPFVLPGDYGDHAQGNGLGGDGPPPKDPVVVQEPARDPPGFDRYLSLKALELVAGPEAAYYTPGLVKFDEPLVSDGSAWAITQA